MAGPPVEVQVSVNTGGSVAGSVFNWKVMSPGIVTWPVECITNVAHKRKCVVHFNMMRVVLFEFVCKTNVHTICGL